MFPMGNPGPTIFILVTLSFLHKVCSGVDLEIKCLTMKENMACLFEEGDDITLLCRVVVSNTDDKNVTSLLVANEVSFFIGKKQLNESLVQQRSSSEVVVLLPAVLEDNRKFASCVTSTAKPSWVTLHVLAKPTIPEITHCQKIQPSSTESSTSLESFQCSWKPNTLEEREKRKGKIVQALYWARSYKEEDSSSSLEWKPCPMQEDGTCTWQNSGNVSQFFVDDEGSTDGWLNCVRVLAFIQVESEEITMKNHSSEMHCFSMAAEVDDAGLSKAAVVGITLGVVMTVLLVAGILIYCRIQRKKMASLKIEMPEVSDIQLMDKSQQENHYYDPDEEKPQTTWRDSWVSSATTPSTANSTAPLITSNGQHFPFPAHSNQRPNKTYVKSRLPNSKAKVQMTNSVDQTDLIKKLLSNNNKLTEEVTYAVINNPQNNYDKNNDTDLGGSNLDDEHDNEHDESLHKETSIASEIPDYSFNKEWNEDEMDGIYTCDTTLSGGEIASVKPDLPSPGGNSMTVYTVIAPNPTSSPTTDNVNVL